MNSIRSFNLGGIKSEVFSLSTAKVLISDSWYVFPRVTTIKGGNSFFISLPNGMALSTRNKMQIMYSLILNRIDKSFHVWMAYQLKKSTY